MKVAILGTGHVGQAIAQGLSKTKHEVRFGSRDPTKANVPLGMTVEPVRRAAEWGEAVIVAVPFSAVKDTLRDVGPGTLKSKTVVDTTNAISSSGDLALGFNTSGAEELARLAPEAKVVKAFNTIFAANMSSGRIGGQPLTLPVAGDDAKAKAAVIAMGRDIGFEPVDAGPLRAARYLEPMGMHMISLGYGQKMGTAIGYRLVRAGAP